MHVLLVQAVIINLQVEVRRVWLAFLGNFKTKLDKTVAINV